QADFIDKIKRDKNFAVVGNGPVEIGSKNGSIIDSFDIVIRFNNYNLDHEYSVDYGTKTTVWVKSGYYQDIDRRYNGQFEL
ncbi:glycosyltransferase family 29 protein, partial [Acinetobacter baumannii]